MLPIFKTTSATLSLVEKVETALKLQGGSKSAIEIASQAVRKCGHVALVGVYGTKYNNFPLGNFFTRNITLKMGQCPATRYVKPILEVIYYEQEDIITMSGLNQFDNIGNISQIIV